jgi:hypothetical protein
MHPIAGVWEVIGFQTKKSKEKETVEMGTSICAGHT